MPITFKNTDHNLYITKTVRDALKSQCWYVYFEPKGAPGSWRVCDIKVQRGYLRVKVIRPTPGLVWFTALPEDLSIR